jgi:branched-chain amino acid transport system ATP-binding protein
MLEVRDLHVRYGAVPALHGVSFEVRQGEIVTLIGANGAGKSTTLRAISGMLQPSAGSISFQGRALTLSRSQAGAGFAAGGSLLAALRRAWAPSRTMRPSHEIVRMGIAHSPEGRGIFSNLTVEENMHVGAFVRSDRDGIREDFEKVFKLFPRLLERRGQLAGTLSGGEQQMLAIGRALLARPRLLLLDEPSLGLAPQVVATIFKIIREINDEGRGTTILLVEQNANKALEVAHRGYVLEVGRIVLADDAKKLASSDEVRKHYLGVGH